MEKEVLTWVCTLIVPTLLTGLILFYIQREQKKRDEKEEKRVKTRQTEAKLALDLQMATAKLSYAVAMAIKRGTPNGEVEEGIDAYNKALDGFREFERKQLSKL